MKNSNDTIGNRTRDLPTCSAVHQPTAPPRASNGNNTECIYQVDCDRANRFYSIRSHLFTCILYLTTVESNCRNMSLGKNKINESTKFVLCCVDWIAIELSSLPINPYRTAFPYGNGMVLHFYQQQDSSTTKTVHKVINKGLKTYV